MTAPDAPWAAYTDALPPHVAAAVAAVDDAAAAVAGAHDAGWATADLVADAQATWRAGRGAAGIVSRLWTLSRTPNPSRPRHRPRSTVTTEPVSGPVGPPPRSVVPLLEAAREAMRAATAAVEAAEARGQAPAPNAADVEAAEAHVLTPEAVEDPHEGDYCPRGLEPEKPGQVTP